MTRCRIFLFTGYETVITMNKHYYFKDAQHYANFIRAALREVGVAVPDNVYQDFLLIFETAEFYGIFTDVSEYSWSVKQMTDSDTFCDDDLKKIILGYRSLSSVVDSYRFFEESE